MRDNQEIWFFYEYYSDDKRKTGIVGEILELYKQGLTQSKIAKEIDKFRWCVNKVIQKSLD